MGTDIVDFIECRASWYEKGKPWSAAVDLLYMGRSYDAFGCLFGVRNRAGFRPLAAGRGLPGVSATAPVRSSGAWRLTRATPPGSAGTS
ncbi:hypothetical protein AB0N06_03510 [Streptomyces sp. NPDC051020]|uniref:hypothetical protein n=1 Tax=Streptomyces sp. NPDC051020 TaxID=3155409 RepID=UPI00344730E1